MYKQFFPSPLRSRLPNIQCGHNAFTHHVLPRLVHDSGMTVIEELETSPSSASDFLERALTLTNDAHPMGDEHSKLSLRDISVTLDGVHEASLVILTLTEPQEPGCAYFIGLLASLPPTSPSTSSIRYFVLERTAESSTALYERTADTEKLFTHHLLVGGTRPTERAFTEAITIQLALADGAVRG